MTNTAARWTRVSDEGGNRRVLAVDFDGSGRPEATFRDLARLLPGHFDVWHAVAPPDSYRMGEPADRYLTWWGDYLRCDQEPVAAVLGYCAGSMFASALADRIEATAGRRPAVLLFNPGAPSVDTIHRDFDGIIGSMPTLNHAERCEMPRRSREIRDRHNGDFERVSCEFAAMYLRACETVFGRLGIDPDICDELTGLFQAYLRYLSAARQIPRQSGWKSASSLCSIEHVGTGFTDREIVFDLRRSELLRSRKVAATTGEILSDRMTTRG